MIGDGEELFREEQRFSSAGALVVVVAVAALAAAVAHTVHPPPALLLVPLGIGAVLASLMMRFARLVVIVRRGGVEVRFPPFMRPRLIDLGFVASHQAVRYAPLADYGGWGIRGLSSRDRAYTVRGDRGVRLVLRDGSRLLLGSQRADALDAAIARATAGA